MNKKKNSKKSGGMSSNEIRQSFLNYFEKLDHKIYKSAPVIPYDDPTLLFTNAGMNQFKDIFTGKTPKKYNRIADTQKCIRLSGKHNDLEEVGKDTYHHTFFEMLGNWSFGDYYKKEAIKWAWDLLTKEWGFSKDRLYATVFKTDLEAFDLWTKVTDISKDRIYKFDEKDNFWEMGDVGPCGPCSEIHYDLGEEICENCDKNGKKCGINQAGCSRYIEIWNLVFIQYNRNETGNLTELPEKHVDTGMGFERLCAVLQNKNSNYDIDIFEKIFSSISKITGKHYTEKENQIPMRVIADHIRMLTFSIADGGLPSNEGRGYVIRRVLRRASRYGRQLDLHDPFMYRLVQSVIDSMGDNFPEISERQEFIEKIIKSEEESFNNTLDRGIEIFYDIIKELEKKGDKTISGKNAFKLYDTYGFPLDLTQLMAEEKGFDVDTEGFDKQMKKQKQKAKSSVQFKTDYDAITWTNLDSDKHSQFVGYDKLSVETKILRYSQTKGTLYVVLEETPFYSESGGQIGDTGEIFIDGDRLKVIDTRKIGDDSVSFVDSTIKEIKNPNVVAVVEDTIRKRTQANHTATHLLHKALKFVLGEHTNQQGSYVDAEKLRFDFNHFNKIGKDDLMKIEQIVNDRIKDDMKVSTEILDYEQAKKSGATALFGEKYGDKVRVVSIDKYSKELCGGTHVHYTGEIGYFRITSESSISSGIRRIEAVSSDKAFELVKNERLTIENAQEMLNCKPEEIITKIENLQAENKRLQKEVEKAKLSKGSSEIDLMLEDVETINQVKVLKKIVKVGNVGELKNMGDALKSKLKDGIGLLGTANDGKVSILCVVGEDLSQEDKYDAGKIIKEVSRIVGGSGGGKKHFAIGGGQQEDKLKEALEKIKDVL